MLNWLRTFKATYILNNLVNYTKIAHNKTLFREHGIKRPLSWPIRSEVFDHLPQPLPWIDSIKDLGELKVHPSFQAMSAAEQALAQQWFEHGYLIFENFFSSEEVEDINSEIDHLLSQKTVSKRKNNRIFFAYRQSAFLKEIVGRKSLLELMSQLTGKRMAPFQSLNFIKGSQQKAHSDSIHMTTYPKGYLTAIWIALETVDDDNGPLFYYPGSHRLPYVMNRDFDHGGNRYRIGSDANGRYEEKIEEVIQEHKLERKTFHAKPGDMLIWHANLIHGGDPIRDAARSRKSMVVHYFGEDVICYHELTQRLALLPTGEYH